MSLTNYVHSFMSIPYNVLRGIGFRMFAKSCTSNARLDGKTVIITGGNTGIGKETALDMARRGAKVIICCRDSKRGEEALKDIMTKSQSNNVRLVLLDLASLKSVREAAKHLIETEPEIHILINNAGVMACPRTVTDDGYELQFQTNHLGHFLFTLLLLDVIKKSAPARIINISSNGHQMGTIKFDDINSEKSYSRWSVYGQSKLANILFTRELSRRLTGSNVNVYAVHPGAVNTELGRHINVFLQILFKPLVALLAKDPPLGAQTTIYCAVDEKAGNETGLYYADCEPMQPSREARNDQVAQRLWDLSLKMVHLETDPTA